MIEFALFLAAGLRLGMPWWYFFLAFMLLSHKAFMAVWKTAKTLSEDE